MTAPKCIPLELVSGEAVGGKAEGLVRLLGYGFDVPSGFVVIGATSGNLPMTSTRSTSASARGK